MNTSRGFISLGSALAIIAVIIVAGGAGRGGMQRKRMLLYQLARSQRLNRLSMRVQTAMLQVMYQIRARYQFTSCQ